MIESVKTATRVYLEQNLSEPEIHPIAGGWSATFSSPSRVKETPNEDAAALIPAGDSAAVIAVADGCGGMAHGETASRLALEALHATVEQAVSTGNPLRTAILDAIEKANRAVRDLGTGAATTLAVVEIDHNVVRPYHVGDSPVLLVGGRGKVKLQTTVHSPVGYAVEAGVISEEEAIHHEDRHLVSNVVGTRETHIEIGPRRRMAARDTLLVASDGLFDNLHLDEIVQVIRKGPLQQAARQLASHATQRMDHPTEGAPSKPDDLTFILFRPRQ